MTAKKPRRNTLQRKVVLEELKKLGSHPTAAELYEIARARLPRISLGTVYRNLEFLSQRGLIRKLPPSGAEARFDGNLDQHYHVRCVRCGRVDDAHGLSEDPVADDVKTLSGYKILGFHLEFIGVCPECRRRPTAEDDGASPAEGE